MDRSIMLLIAVALGFGGIYLWLDKPALVQASLPWAKPSPDSSSPAAKPATDDLKAKPGQAASQSGQTRAGNSRQVSTAPSALPKEAAAAPEAAALIAATAVGADAPVAPTPAATPPAVAPPPPPFPGAEQIPVGSTEESLRQKYGDPSIWALTLNRGRVVGAHVYARDLGRSTTVIRFEDGKVAGAFAKSQPKTPAGFLAPPRGQKDQDVQRTVGAR